MILDKLAKFSDAQALTATAISTNVVDLAVAGSGLPNGEELGVMLNVNVAPGGTSPTFTFDVVTSAAAGLTSPTILGSRTIAAAALTAGSKHHIPIAKGIAMLRYLGVNHTLGGTSPTITISSQLLPSKMADDVPAHYPIGSVIL